MRFVGRGLPITEAAQLLPVRDVQPIFQDDGAVVGELPLEIVNLGEGALPVLLVAKALDPLNEDAPIPRAIKHGGAAVARDVAPESPEVVRVFFLGGRLRDRDDAVVPRVDRAGEAANGAALAGRVPALEGEDDRALGGERSPHRVIEPAEPFLAQHVVVRLGELLGKREGMQPPQSGGAQRARWRQLLLPCQSRQQALLLAETIEDQLDDGEIAGPFVFRIDGGPHGSGAMGDGADQRGGFLELGIDLMVVPVLVGHAPGQDGIVAQRPEPAALGFFRELEPNLNDERAPIDEQFLEIADALGLLGHLAERANIAGLFAQGFRIPRTGVESNSAQAGQTVPEAPLMGMGALVVGRGVIGKRLDATGVEPFGEGI